MHIHAIIYHPGDISDDLYERALGFVDPDSAKRIRRFYRREDACRTLIGRLLVRNLLKERGVSLADMSFATTEAGKPFITTTGLDPPIAYNITHDNALVALAHTSGIHGPPAYMLGIDIMKVKIPRGESFRTFVDSVSDQLTLRERQSLLGLTETESLQRFFWIWTMKEAYTKALGIGLGFDFTRVEYDVKANTLHIDGKPLVGWRFEKLVIEDGADQYQAVVAEHVGGEGLGIQQYREPSWLHVEDAKAFIERTLSLLSS